MATLPPDQLSQPAPSTSSSTTPTSNSIASPHMDSSSQTTFWLIAFVCTLPVTFFLHHLAHTPISSNETQPNPSTSPLSSPPLNDAALLRHQAPVLTPTLSWHNTDVHGRVLLATTRFANNIPLDHNASLFSTSLNVIWINMRPHRLQVPIPLSLSATQFTYAARIFSGHCPSPYYYSKMGLFGYSASCPCSFPLGSSAHIALVTSTIGSHACSAPASLPGGGSLNAYLGLQVRLPHGFMWRKIPHNHSTTHLRTAITIHVCAFEEYTPTSLINTLCKEEFYDVSLAAAYYDYHRLRSAFCHKHDPSVHTVIERYLTDTIPISALGPASRGFMF
ncbi:hypothetical protein BOTBODRAFT_182139 [Botryobasidium botryosum FD-172 SS1]|uniref:Uncharacterized protein n=1 Tax=Botryobasidium botryosum (strain FD-172 SS1) TaxID=930990 RepID=A0A067LS78_BOTB1|nr:hypothetical protein BOTBODRAFT_182139 [Botryobasidium botryosum FD-172 SS1]